MSHDKARSRYRKAVALELRQQGYSYDEIAQVLEFKDRSGAWRCVMRALESREVTAGMRYRILRYAELEQAQRDNWQKAQLGDHEAICRLADAAGERAALLQLV